MTLDELDRLAAEKLDRLSAELIMGWNLCTGGEEEFMWLEKDGHPTFYYLGTDEIGSDDPWQPTRNIAQAWEVVNKITENIPYFALNIQKGTSFDFYSVQLFMGEGMYDHHIERGKTLAEALVKICLKAYDFQVLSDRQKGVKID